MLTEVQGNVQWMEARKLQVTIDLRTIDGQKEFDFVSFSPREAARMDSSPQDRRFESYFANSMVDLRVRVGHLCRETYSSTYKTEGGAESLAGPRVGLGDLMNPRKNGTDYLVREVKKVTFLG